MTELSVTKPYVTITFIKDDNSERLVALLLTILLFIWIHRFTFLTLFENINLIFNLIFNLLKALDETIGQIKNLPLGIFKLILLSIDFYYLPG